MYSKIYQGTFTEGHVTENGERVYKNYLHEGKIIYKNKDEFSVV